MSSEEKAKPELPESDKTQTSATLPEGTVDRKGRRYVYNGQWHKCPGPICHGCPGCDWY